MAVLRLVLTLFLLMPAAVWASDDDHDHDDHGHEDHAETHDHKEHGHDEDGHDEHAHDDHAKDGDDHSDHVTRIEGLEILHAWAQATEGDDARIFMEIANVGDTDLTITGGDTEIGGAVTLMAISYSDGGKPVDIGSFPLKAGAEIDLTPDGLFLHVADLSQHLDEGMSFDMHIDIDPIGEVEIVVEVEAADAATHSHAGHNH